jgi:hypothetical protein
MTVAVRRDNHMGWREDTVEWDGVAIPYRYCHSRRRSLGMTIRPDKSVSVRVPLRISLAAIREFVSRRGAWIVKIWERFDNDSPAPVQSYGDGAFFLFQGVQYRLALEHGDAASVQVRGDRLVVATPDDPSSANLVKLVDSWYRERAVELFRERLIACHGRMQLEETAPPSLVIRPMTSRWGSYSYRTRRINLNLNLIKVPQACLDYVICHELCHVTVRHHGPAFWRLVGRHCPDYAGLRRQLATFIPVLH